MTQQEALAILESGKSVLLTGAAGTGKTYLINEFIRRSKKRKQQIAVTATTGLAATHLNGTTIHSWAGIGVHDELPNLFFQKLGKQRSDLITKADILVIDEISMLHDYRLDMIEEVTRKVRGVEKPFGGLQVVLVGDFFQLPPVNRHQSRAGSFVLSSNSWMHGDFTVCYLQEQYRQSEDDAYSQILNGIRAGVLTRTQLTTLQNRIDAVLDPTKRDLLSMAEPDPARRLVRGTGSADDGVSSGHRRVRGRRCCAARPHPGGAGSRPAAARGRRRAARARQPRDDPGASSVRTARSRSAPGPARQHRRDRADSSAVRWCSTPTGDGSSAINLPVALLTC